MTSVLVTSKLRLREVRQMRQVTVHMMCTWYGISQPLKYLKNTIDIQSIFLFNGKFKDKYSERLSAF